MRTTTLPIGEVLPESARVFFQRRLQEAAGLSIIALTAALGLALATWSIADPSLNHATDTPVRNALGVKGAMVSDLVMQLIGISSIILLAPLGLLGWKVLSHRRTGSTGSYLAYWLVGTLSAAAVASLLPTTDGWPLPTGLGGVVGDALVALPKRYFSPFGLTLSGLVYFSIAILALSASLGMGAPPSLDPDDAEDSRQSTRFSGLVATPVDDRAIFDPAPESRISPERARRHPVQQWLHAIFRRKPQEARQTAPVEHDIAARQFDELGPARSNLARPQPVFGDAATPAFPGDKSRASRTSGKTRRGFLDAGGEAIRGPVSPGVYVAPAIHLLAVGKKTSSGIAQDSLEQNARLLEGVLEDFSVKGDIVSV
ncbi:DNA translocase FtsK 4TM domain-containing protein, partial [Rhodoblastus sp. 17X3]|uniref:DNA translocase FtsK 4TM domain-containing protein n=1 Tax=Rhodoblastus sp. 17X3 TaxID=3047026 RepID=UPI0024B8752D